MEYGCVSTPALDRFRGVLTAFLSRIRLRDELAVFLQNRWTCNIVVLRVH